MGFTLLSGQGFYALGLFDLWPTDPKIKRDHLWIMANIDTNYGFPKLNRLQVIERMDWSIGIIYGSLPTKTLIMVYLSLIGFMLLSGQGFYAPAYLDLRPTDSKINRDHLSAMANYDTKFGIPKLNRFQVIERTRILCSRSLTPKPIRMIYGSWPSMIPRKVNLGEISLKHGKDFANTRTDRRMALGITQYDRRSLRAYKNKLSKLHSQIFW